MFCFLSGRVAAGAVIAAGLLTAASFPAFAQDYPNKPVRVILPFGAGGVGDTTGRIVAERLSEKLGQRFVIENIPGPGGMPAARAMLSGPPDGYILGMLTNGTAITVPLFKNLSYDPVKDFAPISNLGYFEFMFATGPESGFKTLGDVLKAAREKPGTVNVGTTAVGSGQNLAAELLKSTANVNFQIVTYRTTPDMIVGAIRNDVQLMVDAYSAVRGPLTDGKLIGLGSARTTRSPSTPNIPTVKEAGGGDFEIVSWNGLFAPAGTPPEVIATLNKALHQIFDEPDTKKRLLDLGIEAKATTPDEAGARLRDDIAKWARVIERANIPKQ